MTAAIPKARIMPFWPPSQSPTRIMKPVSSPAAMRFSVRYPYQEYQSI